MEILPSFASLGLNDELQKALKEKGFEEPTEIQRECIPLLLNAGTEVIGQAQTGTGKTAAFGLPILQTINPASRNVEALILTPTRELALQVSEEINSFNKNRKIEIAPIYGGTSMENQLRKLKKGVQIVVGTPGRILDHIRRGSLDLSHLEFMVLDEADEMLDMGFLDDIKEVLKSTPEEKRMLLFSATMPKEILKLSEAFMHNPTIIRTQKQDTPGANTDQIYYEVRESDKLEALTRIIDKDPDFYGVVFCRTKLQCDEIARKLQDRGYDAEALHGDLSQRERENILNKLKSRQIRILVATDVAARGLDIKDLTHVINYSLPEDPEVYIHRVGRTGRAGRTGTAITFITPSEARRFSFIKRASKSEIRKEEVPSPSEIVESKRNKIRNELEEALKKEANAKYLELAEDITENRDPVEAIASLLSYIYKNELDETQYKKIESFSSKGLKRDSASRKASRDKNRPYDKQKEPNLDEKGETRVFIAKGSKDGFTKRDLAKIIINQTGASNSELNDIQVFSDFSFVTAPFDIAEKILKFFNKRSERPVASKAKFAPSEKGKTAPSKSKMDKKDNPSYDLDELKNDEDFAFASRKKGKASSKAKSKAKKITPKSKTRRGRKG